MYPLRNPIRRYAWGSRTAIPGLLGVPPDGTTQAEMWMGAHPQAPSLALIDGDWLPLSQLITADPVAMLGASVRAAFGELPFLFKVLAAAEPLSLQVHPNQAEARAGFAREEAAGIAPDDPARNYRDANHKPELLCALRPFDVLSGFRPPGQIAGAFTAFGLDERWVSLARLGDLGPLCDALWALDAAQQQHLVDTVRAASSSDASGSDDDRLETGFVQKAAHAYPGDVGVIIALCLNPLRLAPGDALFAPAGRLHSYVEGLGVELMANSDNVVRAGLTTKAVDVAELRRLVDTTPTPATPLRPTLNRHTGEATYPHCADEFALSRFTLSGTPIEVTSPGPEILLCVEGEAHVSATDDLCHTLGRGHSLFVPAASTAYALAGTGTIYRAQVGVHAT